MHGLWLLSIFTNKTFVLDGYVGTKPSMHAFQLCVSVREREIKGVESQGKMGTNDVYKEEGPLSQGISSLGTTC